MCLPQGRMGDLTMGHGVCPTPMVSGAFTVLVDCLPATRMTDKALFHVCVGEGAQPTAIMGSMQCFMECLPAFRMSESLSCGDILMQGSMDCFVGG